MVPTTTDRAVPMPEWERPEVTAQGAVLYCEGQPVAICASQRLAQEFADELSARSAASLPLVRAEVQRRGDVVAELRRQLEAMERRVVMQRAT